MSSPKKLNSEGKAFVPTPTKTVDGIEPIVVQAVECLFPDVRHHKYVFNILRERGGTRTRLALLKYCDKDSEKLRAASYQSHPHFWMDEISPIFRTMEDAEEWVRSISESHPNWDSETQTINSNNETHANDEKLVKEKDDSFEGNIPKQFRQRFGGELFSHCSFCSKELLKENTSYLINKIYRKSECVYEIAYCVDCSLELRKTYSTKSIEVVTELFPSEDELKRRRLPIILTMADKDRLLTRNCVICETEKDSELGYHEYAYCENDKLGYGIYPYMMCESCVLKLYNMLSKETIDAYHRFMEEHFGLPPEFEFTSGKEKMSLFFI